MHLRTEHLARCLQTLEKSLAQLDLVLRNSQQLDVPQKNLYKLRDALSESNLPIIVDVLDWARIPEEFCRDIERQHVVVAAPSRSEAK